MAPASRIPDNRAAPSSCIARETMQVAMTREKMPGSASWTAVRSLSIPREFLVSPGRISIV